MGSIIYIGLDSGLVGRVGVRVLSSVRLCILI